MTNQRSSRKKANVKSELNNITITAVLPAHNEAKGIGVAINSIRPYVNKIIVACDNCDDKTAQIAKEDGADDVFNTVNNHYRKAGALNQALERHVNWKIKDQYLLIMDADTRVIHPDVWFNKAASLVYPNRTRLSQYARNMSYHYRLYLKVFHKDEYNKLFKNRAYDCVGSIFQAPRHLKHYNYLTEGQRLEWEGYASKIERTRKVFVLTGTCSLFNSQMLWKVYRLHHYRYFYNNKSLTEDFFMTLSLKECKARMISPTNCVCATATKGTIKSLMEQRRRWYAGALQSLDITNVDDVTLPYWGQQIMLFISTFAFLLFLLVSVYIYLTFSVKLTIFWTIVFIGYDLDQVSRIWKYSKWIDRIYSVTMIGCLLYSLTLQISYCWALYTFIMDKKVYWNHQDQQKGNR